MIEGGFVSVVVGGGGEPMDGEPGPETSAETTLGGFELAVAAPVVGVATGVMGAAVAAGLTTGDGEAGLGGDGAG